MTIRILFLTLTLTLALIGCDRQGAQWEEAQQEDTVAAYQSFVERYPDSPEAEKARNRIQTLRAEQAWTDARQRNTAEAYRGFIEEHPQAEAAEEARARLQTLERESRWQALADSEDIKALRAFADKYAGSPEAALARERADELEAKAQIEAERAAQERELQRQREAEREARRRAEQGTHRVQLAVVRGQAQANAGVEQLRQRLDEVLGDVTLETQQTNGLYRLVTRPMSREQAQGLCESLKQRGQDCLVRQR